MPTALTPYKDALPVPDALPPLRIDPDGTRHYRIVLRAGERQVHSELPKKTPFWGYAGSYPGPMIETPKDNKVVVEFVNELPLPPPEDLRSQWPFFIPKDLKNDDMHVFVPPAPWTVVHLHGSPTPAESDGWTDNAYFPGGTSVHHYPPQLSAALLWYHDHANMITRLNVYAGLAGLYLVRDPALEGAKKLPVGKPYEIPLLLQDRNLEVNPAGDNYTGRFAYQELNSPSGLSQADYVVVNGVIWPFHNVAPGRYRLRLLNGSNGRFFRLAVRSEGQPASTKLMTQIGVDGGFLENPVVAPTTGSVQDGSAEQVLTLGPAERADVLLDLSGFAPGTKVDLVDVIPFNSPVPVMRFVIVAGPPAATAIPLSFPRSARLPKPPARASLLARGAVSGIPNRVIGLLPKALSPQTTMLTINDRAFHDTVEEQPALDTEEVWEFLNVTGEEHPMHLHLVNFEVLDRRGFEIVDADPNTYPARAAGYFRTWLAMPVATRRPLPQGLAFNTEVIPRDANEIAPKDTVRVPPFTLTRIHVAFKFHTGMYMYHCHILEHEDMEMMRPLLVVPKGMHTGPGPAPHDHGGGSGHGH